MNLQSGLKWFETVASVHWSLPIWSWLSWTHYHHGFDPWRDYWRGVNEWIWICSLENGTTVCLFNYSVKTQVRLLCIFYLIYFTFFYLNIAHNSISITSHIAVYKNDKNVEKPRRTTDGLPKKRIQMVETENLRVPNLPKQHLKKGNTNT